jgi:ABC-2 type transport system permease protein
MNSSTRVFFIGGLMSYRALFGFMSPWIFVPSLIVTPLFQILLFVYIGRTVHLESDKFYVIGNALQYIAVPCLFAMTQTIAGERYQQTLGNVLITPAGRLPLFLGRSLPVVLNGAFVAALSLALAGLVLGIAVPGSALAPLLVVVLVTSFSCTGLGLVNAALGLRVRENAVLSNILFGLLLIFSGANVNVHSLPSWMYAISQGVPLTHGIAAARRLADGSGFVSVTPLIAAELAVGAIYGVVGYTFLRFMERQARLHATLELA